ncbi:hypothetical protein BDF14DRAFT_1738476 [Spinellus fusiger]|nr:hypothetical protein BDF14DRAFT_1738476 [Spinellus fusiger]
MSYTPNSPPYPAYRATVKDSFAWDSTVRRWPIIVEGVVEDVKEALEKKKKDSQEYNEGHTILQGIERLKTEMKQNELLRPIQDSKTDTETWNLHLKTYFPSSTWLNGTWLFNECYLYRRLHECFAMTTYWRDYDPFLNQKNATFRSSYSSVFSLARKMPEFIQPLDKEQWTHVYHELVQVCLWGNATDLSLLTNMTVEDIKRLQAIEKDRLKEQQKFIVVDHTDQLLKQLETMHDGCIEFVLDNSGFELFVDMIFADWLIQTKTVSKVILNCKPIPWFVSDVMPKDVQILIDSCLDRNFFPQDADHTNEDVVALETLAKRWEQYIENGTLVVRSHDFWCSGLPYCYLKSEAPALYETMQQSDLVIFKGDLNFRKLVFCCDWPVTTPFVEAIGKDMADFTSVLSLRTNKADAMVGLKEGQEKEIEEVATYNEWRCSGKYAVIQYSKGYTK